MISAGDPKVAPDDPAYDEYEQSDLESQASVEGGDGSQDSVNSEADGPFEGLDTDGPDTDGLGGSTAEFVETPGRQTTENERPSEDSGPSDRGTGDPLAAMTAERDEYLGALQRLKAEFANARRRNDEAAARTRKQAAANLVEKLLPVLDSCDAALAQGVEEVRPIGAALFEVLAGQGLKRLEPADAPFDPECHDAVMHEQGDGTSTDQTVIETLRTGYIWNERVLRPAMVRVQG